MKKMLPLIGSAVTAILLCISWNAFAAGAPGVTPNSIKIGVPGPFSGNASSYSKAEIGLEAYFKSINDTGGIHGRKIDIVQVDTGCDEAKGIAAVKRLISQDNVFMIAGDSCSGVALAVKPIIVSADVPWVVGHAASEKIATPAEANVFQLVPTNKDAGYSMADFAMSKPGTKRIAIVSHSNEWASGYREAAIKRLKQKYGIEPVLNLALERGATNATSQALKIRGANIDFVMAILYEPETALFLREAHKYGLKMPVLGSYGTDLQDTKKILGSQALVDHYYTLHMFQGPLDSPKIRKWGEMIKKYYPNQVLSAFSYASIGAGETIVKALKAAGKNLTRAKFIDQMNHIKGFDTGVLASHITITPHNHAGASRSYVAGYVNGKETIFTSWDKPAK